MAGTSKPRARKRAATPKRVAAARRETAPEPEHRTVPFRGLDLTVPPPSEWGSEIFFLIGDLDEGAENRLSIATQIVVELVGVEQFKQVRDKLKADDVKALEVETELITLFNLVFNDHGTSAGESAASPKS